MGETIYGPLPTEKKNRFVFILWMFLGACLALLGERSVKFIPAGMPFAEKQDTITMPPVSVVTWPSTNQVDISWKSEKEFGNTDTIIVTWPWKSVYTAAYYLTPDRAKELLELYQRTDQVDAITPTQQ